MNRVLKSRPKLMLALLAGAVSILPVAPAFSQTWTGAADNNWFNAANWSGGVPNSPSAAAIIDNGQNNPVLLNASATVGTLTLGLGDSLDQTGGLLAIAGGSIVNAGDLELGSQLQINSGDLTLSGSGTFTLSGNGQIGGDGQTRTLFNEATILGAGVIGSNAGALYQGGVSINNSGTINANSSGNTLFIQVGGAVTNSSMLEATNGGVLDLVASGSLNNAGGFISSSGVDSTVLVNMDVQGGTFTTAAGGVIETGSSGAFLDASTQGDITLSNGSTYTAGTAGLTSAVGTLDLGTGAGSGATLALSGQLRVTGGDLTLAGPGMVTLSGGGAQIGGDGNARTLNNEVTIAGTGVIGSNAGALNQGGFSLNNSGVIDADVSGSTLTIQVGGTSVVNSNLLEATAGGVLNLVAGAALDDAGGTILASGAGSTVLVNMDVQGGTFTTAAGGVIETGNSGAFLDASTQGAITLSNGSTYTAGTAGLTSAVGTLDLGTGAGSGATLALSGQLRVTGGDLTLAGPGMVTLSGGGAQIGGDGNARTLNNEVTIAGTGVIGSNAGALNQGGFSLNNSGVIDADVSGSTLTIQVGGTSVVNSNLLEATAGGVLNLVAGAALDDAGGTILASGAGSTVLVNMDVQGGTFTTAAGGVIETGNSGAFLDASTQGAITLSNGSTYTAGTAGLTSAVGTLDLGTGAGSGATLALSGQLRVTGGDLTLAGPGMVTLSGGGAQIGGDGNARTLNNEVTIAGTGVIGSNAGALNQGGFSLNNSGIIDANVSGQTLTIQVGGTSVVNSNLLEATNGATLNLAAPSAPLTNAGGMITAAGMGSTVLVNMQIQGGVLNTSNGGVIETGANGAFLNGATANGAITLSAGSTYLAGSNALTVADGTLSLGAGATLGLTGQLQLNGGDVTFTGPGTVALSGGGAQIGGDGGARTLYNEATIAGSGLVGSNLGSLNSNISVINQTAGVLLADISGQTLTIGGTGGLTNNGTMQANAGATLNATRGFTNFSGGTLTGGTYNMYSGTIQIAALGSTGGEIATNAANIRLNGEAAILSDAVGLNALSSLSTNAGGASLTVENGAVFASDAPSFTNNGAVKVGAGSSFTTLAGYAQSGGSSSTVVDGVLTPGAGDFALAGGVLSGSGSVEGAVDNTGGVVNPGDGVGTLHALSYTQGGSGTLDIELASASSFDVLDVLGPASLGGVLDPILKSGFTPTLGETFTFLDYTARTGEFASIANDVFDGGRFMWGVTYNATDAVLTVEQGPQMMSGAPEPSTWALMLLGLGGLGAVIRRAKRRAQGWPATTAT